MTEVLRTPEERFVDLPGFLCSPVYIKDLKGFEGLRMHYVDEAFKMRTRFFCVFTANPRGAIFTGR
jgi:haloalkane dehalogenase